MLGLPLDLLLSPVALAVLGLVIGSFLNVVIHRKPVLLERGWLADAARYLQDGDAMQRVLGRDSRQLAEFARLGASLDREVHALPPMSLSRPGSRCPGCSRPIAWHENIPLLGWLRLRGRCAGCGARISVRYPIVEALTGALFCIIGLRFGPHSTSALYCAAVALLVAAAFIDLDTTLLPDDLTLPLLGLGLVGAWLHWSPVSLGDAALGGLFGYFSLWAIARFYKAVRQVEGMAEGDFKLLAGVGALLGWQVLPSVVLLASGVGAAVGISLILFKGHRREVPIPFGPYLAGGGVAAMFFGQQLTQLWWPA